MSSSMQVHRREMFIWRALRVTSFVVWELASRLTHRRRVTVGATQHHFLSNDLLKWLNTASRTSVMRCCKWFLGSGRDPARDLTTIRALLATLRHSMLQFSGGTFSSCLRRKWGRSSAAWACWGSERLRYVLALLHMPPIYCNSSSFLYHSRLPVQLEPGG